MIFQSSSNKIGRQKTLFLSGLFATLFMIFFLFSKTTFTMFLSLSLIGLFVFASGPVLLALVHDLKTDMPTQVNSIYGNKFWSYIHNCFFMGFIGDYYGLTTTYQVATALAFCALLFAFLLIGDKN